MAAADITVTSACNHELPTTMTCYASGLSLFHLYDGRLWMSNTPVYRPLVNLATLEECHLIQTSRLNRVTIMELVAQLELDLLPAIHHTNAMPPTVQVLSVLHYRASCSFQVTMGVAAGISQPMFSNVLRDVVCVADQYISQVTARYPGSVHDSFILRNSSIPHMMAPLQRNRAWLVGDSSFSNLLSFLTPMRHSTSAAKDRYNEAHSHTRRVIERCFSLMKARFQCLHFSRGALLYKPQKECQIFVACCMLHNLDLRCQIPVLDAEKGVGVRVADEGDMGSDEEEDDEDAADSRVEMIRHYFG
ncbi:putative nuclease HARBI1 [Pleurodeles waltl]|uniref:putative nuclease HARBI1 n=1 Tax=Pleurodeles waltl TaxID=8319 RepID=UPI0037093F4A